MINIDYVVTLLRQISEKDVLGVKISTVQLENERMGIDVNLIINLSCEAQIESVGDKGKDNDMLSVREEYLKNKK